MLFIQPSLLPIVVLNIRLKGKQGVSGVFLVGSDGDHTSYLINRASSSVEEKASA